MGGRYPNQPKIIRVGTALVLVTPHVVAEQLGVGVRKASNIIRMLGVPLMQLGDRTYLSQQALETALYGVLLPKAVTDRKDPELNAYLQEIHSLQFCLVSSRDVDARLKQAKALLAREVGKVQRGPRHPRISAEQERDGEFG